MGGQGWRSQSISLRTQMEKYGLFTHLGTFRTDFSKSGFRQKEESINAIVCDPPYGVRELCKKVGKKNDQESWVERIGKCNEAEEKGDLMDIRVHYPQRVEYPMEQLFRDLVKFAAKVLTIGGRLTFWLPVNMKQLDEHKISHPDMQLVAKCIDPFSDKTGRELWVFEKIQQFGGADSVFTSEFYTNTKNFRDLHLHGPAKIAK